MLLQYLLFLPSYNINKFIFSTTTLNVLHMTHPKYHSTMEHLYTICDMGWTSCSQFQPSFLDFKPRYTPTFIAACKAAIVAARSMRGNQVRGAVAEDLHITLVEQGARSRTDFQGLKRYIYGAFDTERQKPQYEAAGQQYYQKASENNWDAIESLNLYATNYISDNEAILANNDNMPPTFLATYLANAAEFRTTHQAFMQAGENAEEGTQAKVIANNGIYDTLIEMLLDGQYIFRDDDAIRKQFVFSELLERAGGVGTAGVRGTIRDNDSQLPVANATVHILNTNKTALSDLEGRYEIKPLANGLYDIRISAPGYEDIIITQHEVLVGVVSTLNVMMVRIA